MGTRKVTVQHPVGRYEPIEIEARAPLVELRDPQPRAARAAVRAMLDHSRLPPSARDGLVGAVSEVVTNAHSYGSGVVHLQGWVDGEAAVVTVSDEGSGPDQSDLDRRPGARGPGEGGLGLWLATNLCDEVALGRLPHGFAVRLRSFAHARAGELTSP